MKKLELIEKNLWGGGKTEPSDCQTLLNNTDMLNV